MLAGRREDCECGVRLYLKGFTMTRYLMLAGGLWALSALAVTAQEAAAPNCGGTAATWLGGSPEAAVVNAGSAPLLQQASVLAGQIPVFAFRIDGGTQETRIEASAVNNGDPIITLTTMDGQLVMENDDYGGTLNARMESVLEPGDYCVRLAAVGGGAISATLQISRTDQVALLPDAVDTTINACLPGTASVPLVEGPLDAALAGGRVSQDIGAAVGYLRFDLAEAASLTLRAESALLDPQIRLYDAEGVLLAENDDTDGLNARLDFLTALTPGSYCVAAGPVTAGEGTITVSAETLDADSYLRSAWQRGEIAPPEGGDFPVQGIDLAKETERTVLHDGGAQWLAFDVAEDTVLIVSAFGQLSGADPRLVLFGPKGQPVSDADDSEGGLDARLGPVLLEAGRYRLALLDVGRPEGVADGTVRAIGLVFERFARIK
jgi:hypothetical protein